MNLPPLGKATKDWDKTILATIEIPILVIVILDCLDWIELESLIDSNLIESWILELDSLERLEDWILFRFFESSLGFEFLRVLRVFKELVKGLFAPPPPYYNRIRIVWHFISFV